MWARPRKLKLVIFCVKHRQNWLFLPIKSYKHAIFIECLALKEPSPSTHFTEPLTLASIPESVQAYFVFPFFSWKHSITGSIFKTPYLEELNDRSLNQSQETMYVTVRESANRQRTKQALLKRKQIKIENKTCNCKEGHSENNIVDALYMNKVIDNIVLMLCVTSYSFFNHIQPWTCLLFVFTEKVYYLSYAYVMGIVTLHYLPYLHSLILMGILSKTCMWCYFRKYGFIIDITLYLKMFADFKI